MMRTLHNYTLSAEDLVSQREAGRYHAAWTVTFRDKNGEHTHVISAGTADDVDLFREDFLTIILSRNTGLGYCGLQTYDGDEILGEVFFDNPNETIGDLRKEWTEYTPMNLVKIMMNYLPTN